MVNVTRILALADFIEALPPEQFDMSDWMQSPNDSEKTGDIRHDCGTCACIGGWTELLFNDPDQNLNKGYSASTLLGLMPDQSLGLFTPNGFEDTKRYNQAAAVATLRRLAETGEVKWT